MGDPAPPTELVDACMAWCDAAHRSAGDASRLADLCGKFPSQVGGPLGVDVRLALTDLEPRTLFGILDKHLEASDRVILDITHAYRHFPAVATMCLNALRWSKGVAIDQFLYGAFDMPRLSGDAVPVLDLSSVQDIDQAAIPLAVLSLTGRYGELADLVAPKDEDVRRTVAEADILESLNQLKAGYAPIRTFRKRIQSLADDPVRDTLRATLLQATAWTDEPDDLARLLARAERAITLRSWPQALVLTVEAAKLALLRREPSRGQEDYVELDKRVRSRLLDVAREWGPGLREDLHRAFQLRNAAAHGDLSLAGEREMAMETDPRSLERLLRRVVKFARDLTRR